MYASADLLFENGHETPLAGAACPSHKYTAGSSGRIRQLDSDEWNSGFNARLAQLCRREMVSHPVGITLHRHTQPAVKIHTAIRISSTWANSVGLICLPIADFDNKDRNSSMSNDRRSGNGVD